MPTETKNRKISRAFGNKYESGIGILFLFIPFFPAPTERFGILRNAVGVSFKEYSRIFKDSAPNRICQIFC